jgi:23S rRNA (cytosine1962-C5)-methyltransferase
LTEDSFLSLLTRAVTCRGALFDPSHETAFRLFNGFSEGCPILVIDVYGDTALFQNYADPPEQGETPVRLAQEYLQTRLPWLQTAILKTRASRSPEDRRGKLLFGRRPAQKVVEHGVWYALDIALNEDASLYLDTRNLRRWALDHLGGKTVLNAFAYTGSLGVAALAAGATRVIQLDRTGRFLNVAKESCRLNGFSTSAQDFVRMDFFRQAGRFRRARQRFDCIFLDPPFFAASGTGRIDQMHDSARLINKVRPLVNDGGYLVAVNNALYVSGSEYMKTLEGLCRDGYMHVERLVQVPDDVCGYAGQQHASGIPAPTPFNHSTKIAVLRMGRMSDRAAHAENGASGSRS